MGKPHSVPYMSQAHQSESNILVLLATRWCRAIDTTASAMVLPPHEGLAQVSSDEESNFAGR
jgi:hypothetical protein